MRTSTAKLLSLVLLAAVPALGCKSPSEPSEKGAGVAPPASARVGSETASASAASPPDAASSLHLGEPITQTLVTLGDITKHAKDYDGKVVATSGTVFAVCQSMGCWMEIRDESAGAEAHVKMFGHKFFVPKTASGHHARVQARVLRTNPSEECAEEAAEQTGKPVAKLELEATGVELD